MSVQSLSPKRFKHIDMDITGHCNARCRFCFNQWRLAREGCLEKETFRRLIELLPPMVEGYIMLSCCFEPTLHPQFMELVELLPAGFKEKFYFTTNLARRLSEEELHRLAAANLNFINISLLTFKEDMYRRLVRTADGFFFDNLEAMSRIFAQYPEALKVRFITTILKDNVEELPEIAEKAHELMPTALHEFRTPYPGREAIGYLKEQALSRPRLEEAAERLSRLGRHIRLYIDPDNQEVMERADSNRGTGTFFYTWKDQPGGLELPLRPIGEKRGSIRADGLAVFYGLPWVFDLNKGNLESILRDIVEEI